MKLIGCLASLSIALLIGCGKKAPDPTKAKLTPGMEAASKAHDESRYADAVRLYTVELVAEESFIRGLLLRPGSLSSCLHRSLSSAV
jgi:hypothetical protein